jgi:cell division protein FtsI/penicillin-binding protein 2
MLAVILAAAGVLGASLYSITVIKGDVYAAKARTQYSKPSSSIFDRGTIYFSNYSDKGETETTAAALGSGYLVYMNPKLVRDAVAEYEALSHYIALDKETFLSKAKKPNDPYEELMHRVEDKTAQSISGLGLPGIAITHETWRTYPGDSLAAHELGIIGQNAASTTVSGKYGLERSYNDVLSRPTVGSATNIFADLFTGLSGATFGNKKEGNIVTTIEPTVQGYLEKMISQTSATWHPNEIGGVIMDPANGQIVAMASLPTFDPNNTGAVKHVSTFSNPLVEHVYEMGSIMKPLTMAIALDTGTEKPTSTYDDIGCMTLNTKKICNYDGKARGIVPMQEILSQSLNIGAATIALKTGASAYSTYFFKLGFGEKSGIDLPNEGGSLVKNLRNPTDIDIATASYGQGFAVSPIGMARSLSILANGGYLVTPHLVKRIDYTDGTTEKISDKRVGPLFKPQTIEDVRHMLVTVVDTKLANGAVKKEHYSIAAKTGTAEIADPVNGGYYHDRYLHSFFGFFPAYDPKFIVFLYQVEPKGAQYASETLTKPFDDLATFLLNYYNIAPDR